MPASTFCLVRTDSKSPVVSRPPVTGTMTLSGTRHQAVPCCFSNVEVANGKRIFSRAALMASTQGFVANYAGTRTSDPSQIMRRDWHTPVRHQLLPKACVYLARRGRLADRALFRSGSSSFLGAIGPIIRPLLCHRAKPAIAVGSRFRPAGERRPRP
jgi:hypothetical protein